MLHQVLHSMFHMDLPLLEKILRPVVVFLFLAVLLRIFGKRELAQLNPFDLVVLLSLSNTVQNAIIGNDNTVSGGLVGAAALLTINWLVARTLYHLPWLARIVSDSATVLLRDGKLDMRAMRKEALTREDLLQAVHKQGFDNLESVSLVQLDPDGTFYVEGASPSATEKQMTDLMRKVDALVTEVAQLRQKLPQT